MGQTILGGSLVFTSRKSAILRVRRRIVFLSFVSQSRGRLRFRSANGSTRVDTRPRFRTTKIVARQSSSPGGAAVRKLRKRHAFDLTASAEKQNGQAHLKILPRWVEESCQRYLNQGCIVYMLSTLNFRTSSVRIFFIQILKAN